MRLGECQIEPRIEDAERSVLPEDWSVAGITRAHANAVSRIDGNPAYGGTPADRGVRQAIEDLKSRGLAVVFYPFILMDVPAGNGLPDPYGVDEQAPYPWRGRITVYPTSTDQTASARDQINAFFAQYRPMILHYAQLCADAGGVDGFLIGTEMRGLTWVRDEQNRFPAVEAFVALAAEVRTILGPQTKISYAADWSEYFGYRPTDGSGDVYFHLDPLWASDDIDAIGIDNYMPLSDWREGLSHLDRQSGVPSIYDAAYLEANIRGGEGYDWFYASDADRAAQIRTPIIDDAHGEDWVFRYKDLWSWWSSPHYDRPGGVRAATPTAWVPQSKPFWLTELGCSATDKGSNQPNIFFDPKSSESGRPYFSNGNRDDMIQRRFIEAHLNFWDDPENNPISTVYGEAMLDPARIFLYTWDARPFPDFPIRQDVWADAENWLYGHWLNGRAGLVPLGTLIEKIAHESGLTAVDASACQSLVTGFSIDRPLSARDAIDGLFTLYQLDAVERSGLLIVLPRQGHALSSISFGDLVLGEDSPLTITRAQEDDLPAHLALTYTDGLSDYRSAVAEARDPGATGGRQAYLETAIVLEAGEAEGRISALLAEARASRQSAQFGLSPTELEVEPSDVLTLHDADDRPLTVRVVEITDGPYRAVEGVSIDSAVYQPRYTGLSGSLPPPPAVPGPVSFALMDLPILPEGEDAAFLRVAAFASPWPARVAIHRGPGADAPRIGTVSSASVMGRLVGDLTPGPTSRWDEGTRLNVRLAAGGLSAVDRLTVLRGATRAAVEVSPGRWELLAYREASLSPDGVWVLRGLLRGLRGTEAETALGAPGGARIVFLDAGQIVAPIATDLLGTTETWQAGPATLPPGAFPYRQTDITFEGRSLQPFAPAFVTARPDSGGLRVTWTRRTRIGGDNWSLDDVPLGEASEAYRVTSFDAGDAVVETLDVTTPEAVLTVPGIARLTVSQISAVIGPGKPAQLTINW